MEEFYPRRNCNYKLIAIILKRGMLFLWQDE
jgi:hypothetical protein